MEKFMEKNIIEENVFLSNLVQNIVPKEENRFTDIEIEASKDEEFKMIIYKKPNHFVKFFRSIKITIEKFKIMRKAKGFKIAKNQINLE